MDIFFAAEPGFTIIWIEILFTDLKWILNLEPQLNRMTLSPVAPIKSSGRARLSDESRSVSRRRDDNLI